MRKNIHIINGPNLNLLGNRENDIYGDMPFEVFFLELKEHFSDRVNLQYFQSNHEGGIVDYLQKVGFASDGVVINPAAYTHTSIAIADCIRTISAPCIEVHISDIYSREEFRKVSFVKEHCQHSIVGRGLEGYREGVILLLKNE